MKDLNSQINSNIPRCLEKNVIYDDRKMLTSMTSQAREVSRIMVLVMLSYPIEFTEEYINVDDVISSHGNNTWTQRNSLTEKAVICYFWFTNSYVNCFFFAQCVHVMIMISIIFLHGLTGLCYVRIYDIVA